MVCSLLLLYVSVQDVYIYFFARLPINHNLTLDWPPMIPDFVTEGLASPTTSIFLLSMTTLVTALNVEISHLRRVYGFMIINAMASDPKTIVQKETTSTVPTRLPWQLKLARAVGILSTILVPILSLFAPSVGGYFLHY